MTCRYRLVFTKSDGLCRYVCTQHKGPIQVSKCQDCPIYAEYPKVPDWNVVTTTIVNAIDITKLPDGPGTRLALAIKRWFGLIVSGTCDCLPHILQMNEWGYKKCVANVNTIVVWLYEAAIKRNWKVVKLPLAKYAIKRFILHAIKE